jgi:hypothetical protein
MIGPDIEAIGYRTKFGMIKQIPENMTEIGVA